jgi:hypothetical protein
MTKQTVLHEIDTIIDGTCGQCPKRKAFYKNKATKNRQSELDSYCNRQCQIGGKLQALGKVLVTL